MESNNPSFAYKSKSANSLASSNVSSRADTVVERQSPDRDEEGSNKVVQLQPGQKRVFKIIVIGDSNVGKTCLTFRFCGGKFPEKCEATIGVDFREKTIKLGGEEIKLQIWDTAGQERFRRSMVQHYYRNVHAVVFVYDVTKISTFENLTHWVDECAHNNLDRNVPRILVGNKSDEKDRISVTTSMAQKFAEFHDMILFETSAKDEHETNQVDGIFMTIACRLSNTKPCPSPSAWRSAGSSGTSGAGSQILRDLGSTSSGSDSRQTNGSSSCAC